MEELYFSSGNKKNGRTWRKVLQDIYDELNRETPRRYWGEPKKQTIDEYLEGYVHNDNDGGSWTNGQYERIHVGYDSETRNHIYENGAWIPPTWKPREKGWYISDSFDRIIPSGFIKDSYKLFKPDTSIPTPVRYYYRRGGYFTFRKGPVPYAGSHRNGCWHKYAGKHASRAAKKRAWYGDDIYRKEIFLEYGITFRMDNKEFHTNYHNGGKGRGWKRTRKEKQWMRGDIKSIAPSVWS